MGPSRTIIPWSRRTMRRPAPTLPSAWVSGSVGAKDFKSLTLFDAARQSVSRSPALAATQDRVVGPRVTTSHCDLDESGFPRLQVARVIHIVAETQAIRGPFKACRRGNAMLSGRAFRAQLVVQGQRELFDYWLLSAGIRRMPARSDLDPFKVPQLLPHIGLIDVRNGVDGAAFKLAGTRLHDIYGQEITGKRAGRSIYGRPGRLLASDTYQAGGKGLCR